MERTRYRIEVGRQGLEAIEDANGSWEYHADAQRALDAERERTRVATQLIIETIGSSGGPEDLEEALGRMTAQLATLQAQLAQPIRVCQGCGRVGRDGWVTARYECDELHGSLQCPDCQCIDLEINTAKELAALCTQAQAQLVRWKEALMSLAGLR